MAARTGWRCPPRRRPRPGRRRRSRPGAAGCPGRPPRSRRRGRPPRSARRRWSGRRARAWPPAAGAGRPARRPSTGRPAHRAAGTRCRGWPTPPLTPVGARYSPNTSRRAPAHSPVVPPAWARAMVARHDVVGALGGARSELVERPLDGAGVARGPPRPHVVAQLGLHRRVDRGGRPPSPARAVRVRGLGEAVDPDHRQLARLDAPDARSAWLPTSRAFSSSMASKAPPRASTSSSSAQAASASSAVFASTTSTRRRCPRTRGGRTRRPGSAGCAATTAGPRAAAGPVPRSRPAAAAPGPGPA